MCILFIYRNPNADDSSYRLIVATNRDEFYNRPTKPAGFWEKYPNCLGGIDEEPGREGGTWLALSKENKKLGILLNLFDLQPDDLSSPSCVPSSLKKGRGFLVSNLVTSNESTKSYLDKLYDDHQNKQSYNLYTLVTVDLKEASVNYFSNSRESSGPARCDDKILGFGNSVFDKPYQKVHVGKENFKNIVDNARVADEDQLVKKILEFLQSKKQHLPDEVLQTTHPESYEICSSIFINTDKNYGTRTHTLILLDGKNRLTFIENTREMNGVWSQQRFDMTL